MILNKKRIYSYCKRIDSEIKDPKHVFPNIGQLKLRPLNAFDWKEFRAAFFESENSIQTFLNLGIAPPKQNAVDYMNDFMRMLREPDVQHFGVFHGYKMLAYACYCPASSADGIQIVYWVRQEYLHQNIGTWTIGNMTSRSWIQEDFHYSQLIIDKENYSSRRVAKKLNYFPIASIESSNQQGNRQSGTYIAYLHLNPKLNMKSAVLGTRPIDLIGHLGFIEGLEHLFNDPIVNEFHRWKSPLLIEDDVDSEGNFTNWIPDYHPEDWSNLLFE
jgi:hypothetical protein